MQTRDQHSRRPKDWKVIAALTAASALGVSGLALAGSPGGSSNPDPIELRDRTAITSVTTPSVPTTIAQLLEASADQSSLDSPFDDADLVSPSPASVDSPASADSPAPVNVDTASADSAGSTDEASVDSASVDSAGSSDNSADS
jgi:hypothetical protein